MNDAAVETRLENSLANIEHQMLVDFRAATAQAAAKSALQSGGHPLEKARLIGTALNRFVDEACADAEAMDRAGQSTQIIYDTAATKLIQLKLRGLGHVKEKAQWAQPSALNSVRSEVERTYTAAKGRLIDHQAGFGRSAALQPNALHIHAGAGAVVQANSPGAWAQTKVHIEDVRSALDSFEMAAARLPLPPEDADAIKADIETIRAQLQKPSPSSLILRECGQTMRGILENWIAAATQPGANIIGQALWRALGLAQ